MDQSRARVLSVHKSQTHSFSENTETHIELLQGEGIIGDAHCGKFVKHRSRVKKDPTQLNLRQVHLIHSELFSELQENGFKISPGQMGENITTENIDLLALPRNTILNIGEKASIQITGLRNPCSQLDNFQKGLMSQLVFKNENGEIVRKCGVMGIVLKSGIIHPEDAIEVIYPEKPYAILERV